MLLNVFFSFHDWHTVSLKKGCALKDPLAETFVSQATFEGALKMGQSTVVVPV